MAWGFTCHVLGTGDSQEDGTLPVSKQGGSYVSATTPTLPPPTLCAAFFLSDP